MLAEIIESSIKEDSYECLVEGKVIAVVEYDWANDGCTQPWIVKIGGKVVFQSHTQIKSVGWVNTHLKQGTLPTIEEEVQEECEVAEVVAVKSENTDTWTVLAPATNTTIGVIGFSDTWWSLPISSVSGIPIYGKTCKSVLEKLVLIEDVLSRTEMAPVPTQQTTKENIVSLNINKATISKIFTPWSSSKFNARKKSEAVDIAVKVLKGEYHLDEVEFETGTFSERSRCTGAKWRVDRVTQVIQELGERDTVIKTYDFSGSK